jgi:NAD(P)-dependent dehydrogenase (short-subunit alcohol dehydrogenase family)
MSLDLAGARVVVTGAGSGIGFALARHAARAGARVAIVDIRREKADAAAAELAAAGADARGYGCDVTQPADVERLSAAVAADLGGVDMLFNNAGIGVPGKIDEISATDVDWTLAVNVGGITNCVRAFAPALRASAAQGRGAWIVNTGSEHSLGIPTMGANNIYTASKHAVLGLSDVMRSDLGPDGIRIAVLCPGLVSTSLYDAGRARPDTFGGAFSIPEEHRSHAPRSASRVSIVAISSSSPTRTPAYSLKSESTKFGTRWMRWKRGSVPKAHEGPRAGDQPDRASHIADVADRQSAS